MQKFVFVWKPTEVSLVEQSLSFSSLLVIPCRRVHQGQLEESGMVPRCWSLVLDHPVAANRVSRISQEKGIEDLEGIKVHRFSTSSSGITYSGSIFRSRGPRAFLNTCVFHIPHQVSKPIDEEVKDKSAGIGIWRSSNML